MLYSFTQDLEASKASYKNFSELYKNRDNLTRKLNESGQAIGDGYSIDNYETEPKESYDDDDYTNKGGSKKVEKAVEKTNDVFENGLDDDSKDSVGKGIVKAAGLGLEIAQGFSTTSGSEAEGWGQAGKWGVKGATAGMAIGGPIGAAIGGAVGAGAGVVDALGDITKRNTAERKSIDAQNENMFTKRELEGAMQSDEKRIKQLTNLRKNQLNYINLDY